MFKLIPLRSLARSGKHCVDALAPIDITRYDAIRRETYAPNTSTSWLDSTPKNNSFNSLSERWYMHPDKSNMLMVVHGAICVDIYNSEYDKHEEFILSSDNVYRGGKVYYGSPAMLGWGPGVYYKMHTTEEGCALVNFMNHYDNSAVKVKNANEPVDPYELLIA
jgi:hypothetical protein